MLVRERVRSAPRRDHGHLQHLRELHEVVRRARSQHAGTREDHGPARAGQLVQDRTDDRGVELECASARRLRGRSRHAFVEEILRNRHKDRTRPTCPQVAKDLVERIRHGVAVAELRRPLRQPAERADLIDLLEGLASPEPSGHLAHDRDHRRRILARGMDADRHVRGADGPGSDDHRRPARQLAVRLGHERRAALVAGTDDADAFVDERLEERQEALTGDREGKPHAGGAQLAGHERRHGHGWRVHFDWRGHGRRCLVGGCDRRGLGGFDVRGRRARCVGVWRLGHVRVGSRRMGVGVWRLGHVRVGRRRMGVGLWRLGHVRVGSRRIGVGVRRHRRGIVGE